MSKPRPLKGPELVAYNRDMTLEWVEGELKKCKLDSALRLLVGHAVDEALSTPEAVAAYPHQFDGRMTLGAARQTRKAWAVAVRRVIATLQEMAPAPEPPPEPTP